MSRQMKFIQNRLLILPYVAPYFVYVLFASLFERHLSIELNYVLRLIFSTGLVVWGWRWYIPIRGPKPPFISAIIGIVAGTIGAIIWILFLSPFVDTKITIPWSNTAFILRLLAAGLLVPVFEELLMRGFVFRLALQWDDARKMNRNDPFLIALDEKSVNDVAPGAWSWWAVVISTATFTMGHHFREWPASIAFGLLMVCLWIWRKDLISCIFSHSVANIIFAYYVYATGKWYLW